jgi:hypothetical protein
LDEGLLKGLSRLTVLDLSKNIIALISSYFLKPCPDIMWLSLANNWHIGKVIIKVCIGLIILAQTGFDN